MAVYPFSQELQEASGRMDKGNFGLWYNKLIPISEKNNCKVCDEKGDDKEVVGYYKNQYKKFQNNRTTRQLLDQKHQNQNSFGKALSDKYKTVAFKAKLISPLITGIGETHPHEVSMVFDHNLGIPYIPASGMKGIVRFAHTVGLLFDEDGNFTKKYVEPKDGVEVIDEDDESTFIPQIFGTQKNRGAVIFLDAYPETVPDLHIDIMNPHYGEYYRDNEPPTPPADYLSPTPIKFLTVAKETVFIFRALVKKDPPELQEKVAKALLGALTKEGVGAKTAVGYGLFEICGKEKQNKSQAPSQAQTQPEIKPVDKYIRKIESLKPHDAGQIGPTIDQALEELKTDEKKNQFAEAVKKHMGKTFKKSKAKTKLNAYLPH